MPIETKVFGEALAQHHLVAILHELPEGKRIDICVTARETLIGHVEKRQKFLFLEHGGKLFPLILIEITPSRVVCAGMQQNCCLRLCGLEIADTCVVVHRLGDRIIIGVALYNAVGILEDVLMIRPRRLRQHHHLLVPALLLRMIRRKPTQQLPRQPQRPRPTQRLHHRHILMIHSPFSKRHIQRVIRKPPIPRHRQILHIQLILHHRPLRRPHRRQHKRSAVVVAVRADAKIELRGGGVAVERERDPEDRVLGALRDVAEARGREAAREGGGGREGAAERGEGERGAEEGRHGGERGRGLAGVARSGGGAERRR
mmetsp:Transcript_21706/g.53558  ORF Transcript_21706/g.53558 Transcript_21706/m.53558 type:complete len:315 (+) Transcript_21706:135-1079(+)